MIRLLVASALAGSGYEVFNAESPAQAMMTLDSLPAPELLVTDVVMPEIDGCELAARMRQKRPDLKVLFMSGFIDAQALPDLDQSTDFLGKPFDVGELIARVKRILPPHGPEPEQPAQHRTRPPISPRQ
jgi:two-component system cell cycle sensor histidine kinase/response regulator CckA